MERDAIFAVNGTAETVLQAQHVGVVNINQPAPAPAEPHEEWAYLVLKSAVWSHLRPGHDAEPWRQQAGIAATQLASIRDELIPQLTDDPWQDPDMVTRFVRTTGRLLGDLYPAEATLLVLLPMLYRVRSMQLACGEHPPVRPGEEHRQLADRARSEPALGHWLLHRHLARHGSLGDATAVNALLATLTGPEVRSALMPAVVRKALDGLRRGRGVTNPEFLHGLSNSERVNCEGEQYLRARRLVLLAALAYTLAIEPTALPETVADHLGIQDPVLLPQLLETLTASHWGGSGELPVLQAECHHEAVVEALREYVTHADELLHAVQRELGDGATAGLPLRLSAANVAPASGAFQETARFRLDERRMRSLLMGVQLYGDRDLAVRELYQNALDACRYRQARADYRVRHAGGEKSNYRGKITFTQGVDESGRPYLECEDNGVGMGETELRGVFSKAGERFAEQQELLEEREEWQKVSPPVELYPNSRFGIGVLSYFMLADRMTVTTCRIDRSGNLGPELRVPIHGPGHLFRITPRPTARTEAGTTVRLYLNDQLPEGWSAVEVLERLLGIAEFETVATHEDRVARWEPRQLRARKQGNSNQEGLVASGRFVEWSDAPEGVQLIWCEEGGGLLVDGLHVSSPQHTRAIDHVGLPGTGTTMFGVVVNFTGPYSPHQLSVDRTEILDDLSATLESLLGSAASALVRADRGILRDQWLFNLGERNHHAADLITTAMRDAAPRARSGLLPQLIHQRGFLSADHQLRGNRSTPPLSSLADVQHLPAPWLLWRVLAHRPNLLADKLTELVPELESIGPVLPAFPSDATILGELEHPRVFQQADIRSRSYALVNVLTGKAAQQQAPGAMVHRLTALRVFDWWGCAPATVAELGNSAWTPAATARLLRRFDIPVPDAVLAVASAYAHGTHNLLLTPWQDRYSGAARLEPGEQVPLGHLALAAARTGLPLAEVADRFGRLELSAGAETLPPEVPEHVRTLLSLDFDGLPPWLDRSVSLDHLLRSAALHGQSPSAMARVYEDLGLTCDLPTDSAYDELLPLVTRFLAPDDGPLPPRGGLDFGSPLFRTIMLWIAGRSAGTAHFPTGDAFDQAAVSLFSQLNNDAPTINNAIPMAAIFSAARPLRITPAQFAERLNSLGVPTSCVALPPDLPEHAAVRLQTLMRSGRVISLQNLLEASQEFDAPLPRVTEWLRLLGYRVPDITAIVRKAVPLVPLAET
ncbi:wHTH domain-containing protein [Kitasatospora griseola]|uniref:wHTH domain-containing protein n=1 Tax=Kitasatospora griseola TaxID=2064 RepID=UPI0034374813